MSDESNNNNPVVPNEDEGAGLPPTQIEEDKAQTGGDSGEPTAVTENDKNDKGEAAAAPPVGDEASPSESDAEKEGDKEKVKEEEEKKDEEEGDKEKEASESQTPN